MGRKLKKEEVIENLENKLSLEEEVIRLRKDNDRLRKRVDVLNKKYRRANKRAEEAVEEIETELEITEALTKKVKTKRDEDPLKDDLCPKCGSELIKFSQPNGTKVHICKSATCNYKKTIKK